MTAPAPSRRRELKIRLVLGPVMLLLIAALYFADQRGLAGHPGRLSAIVLGVLALAGVHEYVTMLRRGGFPVAGGLLLAFTLALVATAPFFGWHIIDRELYPMTLGPMLLLFPTTVRALANKERMAAGLEEQGAVLLGFIWIAWPLYLAQGLALRHLDSLLYVLLVCKGGDIGGYLLGSAFGRHRLIPHVSAGKTVEGAVGSLLVAVGLALALRGPLLVPAVPLGLTGAALVGIMLNVTTQIGDLVESVIKRRCGVKDSSSLLPAHGGVLDLVDSLLFSFPAYFLVLTVLTGPDR